jgi:dTDP-4-amino-4,6-dideoxygalactose transaminase
MIHLARPEIEQEDLAAVAGVLRSGRLVNGPVVRAFEEEVAAFVGVAHAVAVSSGTAALQLALQVAAIEPGDEVIVPAFTYPATAHAVLLVGAEPVPADVEPLGWNIDPAAVARAITSRTRALLPVDQFGLPCDLEGLAAQLTAGPLPTVIDDAACALGAARGAQRCGSGVPFSCLSFHPRKVITTGEGGMVLTDDAELARQLRQLRNHGRDDEGRFVGVGANWRMGEMAAALGRGQLRRLPESLARRQALAARYRRRLAGHPSLQLQRVPAGFTHSYQTFAVCLAPGYPRQQVISRLAEGGVESTIATYGLQREMPYCRLPRWRQASLPVSDRLAQQAVALPLHGGLTLEEIDRVCELLEAAVAQKA